MRRAAITGLIFAITLVACERESGPPIVISDVRILAPVPGSTTGVAYMTIANNSDQPITVLGAGSPQFERVEMHETKIEDGVSRMRPLSEVRIPGRNIEKFEAGGKHMMLFGALPDTNPDSQVTLEIRHDGGLLLVAATMQNRFPAE
jgi:copper(I)-binding protein